ncbi:MAG: endonuclease/exonuclease/phosphatase family protein, partial [Polyangiales bacterium]
MKRSLVLIGFVAALAGCNDGDESQDVAVVTFNVALAGAFIPYEPERREALRDVIASVEADIICLEEVWNQADKEMLRTAAASTFPNALLFEDDLDSPLNDPTDQEGQVPPAPTTFPCPATEAFLGEGTVKAQMTAAIDCVSTYCNTNAPDDENGRTTSTDCAEEFCLGAVGSLVVSPDSQQQRCYACIATQLPTSTFAEISASCTSDPEQVLAFEGQNGVMILSRYPLKNEANWVLPGTWNRRSILSATAELPNGAELDVYCNHLTPIFDSIAYPYT